MATTKKKTETASVSKENAENTKIIQISKIYSKSNPPYL